jgi:WhiB family transcriptional regulator, redox-sensing transcriptional regulator
MGLLSGAIKFPTFVLNAEPACSTTDPELFFPHETELPSGKVISRYGDIAAAKKICSECPLKLDCLEYALRTHEIGIWGGTTESQRELLRKNQRISVTRRKSPDFW